jgi:hypothetical protein
MEKELIEKGLKTAALGLILGDSSPLKVTVDKTTGFLTAPVSLARVGVQYYMGFELGLKDRLVERIGVMRSAEEVFHPDSIASYKNLVVTDDHPAELVTVDNVKNLQKGTVSEVVPNGSVLSGLVTITDRDQIKKIKDGKVEVSVGYSNILKEETGTYDGVGYEFVQTGIRANHMAIVDAGRCGSACKLTLDHKEDKAMIITIDGIEYDVENKQLGQAIQKMQTVHDAEKEEMEEKLKKAKQEKEDEEKAKEKAEATADALKGQQLSDEDINVLVSERATLLSDAKAILGDKMPECNDCPVDIKTAVIDHVLPEMNLEGKSNDYIDAAYDMAVEKFKKAKGSLDNLAGDFQKKDDKKVTRDSARQGYMKDQLGMEVE